VPVSIFGFAPGIAETERDGASAKAQAANPINKSRFILELSFFEIALSRQRRKCREF
jgi:hypothetical protein